LRAAPTGREVPVNRERTTRKKLPLWDRVKFLLLFVLAWFALVWTLDGGQPDPAVLRTPCASWRSSGKGIAIIVLFGLEVLRQLHYPDQRARLLVPPALDPGDLRRHRAHLAPDVLRLDPVPPDPRVQVAAVHRAGRRSSSARC
jgi:hypothetical protein